MLHISQHNLFSKKKDFANKIVNCVYIAVITGEHMHFIDLLDFHAGSMLVSGFKLPLKNMMHRFMIPKRVNK